jgi:DNA-directed RNA polymerase sigma subunit (sigma70/sigma32)
MNGPGPDAAALRRDVRAALADDGLEQVVRDLLELRFPLDGRGATLDEVGVALGMSPALVSHIEFGALCAIAARRSPQGPQGATRAA